MNSTDLPLDVKLMTLVTNTLLMVFALLCLVVLGHWVLRHPMWQVRAVVVQGEVSHQNAIGLRTQLASSLKSSAQSGLLSMDLEPVRQMFESVPWVKHAVVQREFPNRLRITLKEHQAVAWWGLAGSGYLVDRAGEVFEGSPDDADGLPEFIGPPALSVRVWALNNTLTDEFKRMNMDIKRLELTNRESWRATLDSGAIIELGRGDPGEVLARVHRLTETIGQLTQRYSGAIESIDLRYPNGYALRMRGVTTVVENAVNPISKNR